MLEREREVLNAKPKTLSNKRLCNDDDVCTICWPVCLAYYCMSTREKYSEIYVCLCLVVYFRHKIKFMSNIGISIHIISSSFCFFFTLLKKCIAFRSIRQALSDVSHLFSFIRFDRIQTIDDIQFLNCHQQPIKIVSFASRALF